MRDAVERLRIQALAVSDISNSPFQLLTHGDWSPQWEASIVESASHLSMAARAFERSCEVFLGAIGVALPRRTLSGFAAVVDFAAVIVDCWRKQVAYALEPDGNDRIEALDEAFRRLQTYVESQTSLSCDYEPFAWRKLDGGDISRRWKAAVSAWWPKSYFARRSLVREMQEGGAKGTPQPAVDAPLLTRLRDEGEAIDRLDTLLSSLKDWHAHGSDPQLLAASRQLSVRVRAAVGRLAEDPAALIETRAKVRALLRDGNDLLAPDAAVGRAAKDLIDTYRGFVSAYEGFAAVAGESIRERLSEADDVLSVVKQTTDAIDARHAELRLWCNWRRRRTEALDLELGALVDAVERGLVPAEEIEETFYAAYCAWWSAAVIGEDEVLRTFSTAEHFDAIEKFRQADAQFQKLTSAQIAARLSGKVPSPNQERASPAWGILRREMGKKIRHMPVRQLVKEAPDALMTLKPCLMMSPLSVAQYLSADHAHFDVVIFDEASQITVWDAVGALARGKQVIVAGDPKQLPPTNFFARSDDDPDGEVDVEGDLESILDEMLGASIPQRTLNLHYRSRRESLIAFSNSRYYDNSLVTFPAPVHPDQGIRLVRPEGFYARGGARHNEGEARTIVAEVVRRLIHPDPAVSKASIGVVTFNSEQQSLIENLLDDARGKQPEIEWAFSCESTLEPVFVKNLETVQGDERDVILFSVTYGPDQGNHVTMNFGPLNRSGGERRLNVALTRARSEMVVFSTLDPNRIDLSRTSARAVADLKHFLEYAERGPSALGAAVHGSRGDFESPFELSVARALRAKGWEVHTQIGVSAYRVDLGIVHPDFPGRYLAGIECDGAMYHSSAFARERDKIRQSVLEGLGWTLFRIWSTDWWTHAAMALDTVHQALTNCLEADRKKAAEASAAAPPSGEECAAPPPDEEESESPEVALPPEVGPMRTHGFAERLMPSFREQRLPPDPPVVANPFATADGRYVFAALDPAQHPADIDQFYSESYAKRLVAMIDHVIDTEGPIHEEVLVKRIARHHGFQRVSSQLRETVMAIAHRRRGRTQEDVGRFFWRKGTVKDRLAPARYEERDEELKNIEFICREELKAIHKTLALGEDPVELARRLGVARLSQMSRNRLAKVVRQAAAPASRIQTDPAPGKCF